jgi:hypothetical protein
MLNPKDIMSQNIIYDFDNNSDLKRWVVVDDDVMGGLSSSNLSINKRGNGVFEGIISTANYGGFCSVRLDLKKTLLKDKTSLRIRIKGDGKEYQLRIKINKRDYYSYILPFKTSGEWEVIKIPLTEMYPSFRGRKLNMKNFNSDYFEQIQFLVGNKKNEKFQLSIDHIILL